jgi:hypothetical protein
MISLPNLLLPQVKYFGLSIDRTSLRAVELSERNRVQALAEVEIPENIFTDGTLTKSDVFVEILKTLYAKGKFSTPYVSVSFPEAYAYTREYALPIIPIEEVHEAMSWHVKGLFPFPEEEIYFDWKLLKTTEKEYRLVVVAVQKSVLDPLVGAIITAGLKPLRFEPDASAVARLISARMDQHAIVVDVNKKGAYATLVEGEKSIFTTVVPVVSGDTDETYSTNVRKALDEVAAYYTKKGVLSDTESLEVILTGELASDGWVKALTFSPNRPVRVLTTPVQLPSYNKAYAAAAASIAPPANTETINLLPPEIQSRYDTDRTVSIRRAVATRAFFIALILCIASFAVNAAVLVRKQQLDSELKSLTEKKNSFDSVGNELLTLNAQAKLISALHALRITPREQFRAFGGLLTEGISVSQWEYDDTKLQFTLTGTAQTREELLVLKEKLELSDNFAKVFLPLGSLESPLNVRFTITFLTK